MNDFFEKAAELNSDDSDYNNSVSKTNPQCRSNIQPFSQGQLNNLIKFLALSKEASKVLASYLNEHGILDFKTQSMFCRHRDEVLNDYFAKECNFVFCKNIKDLAPMGVPNTNQMDCLFYR